MRNGPKQHENNVAALSCRTENPPLRCERVVSACGSAATLNLAFSPFLPMALNLRTRRVAHVVGLQPPDQRPAIGDRRAKKRGRKCVKDAVLLSAGPNQINKNVKMCVHNTFIPREPADERRRPDHVHRRRRAHHRVDCDRPRRTRGQPFLHVGEGAREPVSRFNGSD